MAQRSVKVKTTQGTKKKRRMVIKVFYEGNEVATGPNLVKFGREANFVVLQLKHLTIYRRR